MCSFYHSLGITVSWNLWIPVQTTPSPCPPSHHVSCLLDCLPYIAPRLETMLPLRAGACSLLHKTYFLFCFNYFCLTSVRPQPGTIYPWHCRSPRNREQREAPALQHCPRAVLAFVRFMTTFLSLFRKCTIFYFQYTTLASQSDFQNCDNRWFLRLDAQQKEWWPTTLLCCLQTKNYCNVRIPPKCKYLV